MKTKKIASYDRYGNLIKIYHSFTEAKLLDHYSNMGINTSINNNKLYKNTLFKLYKYNDDVPESIDPPYLLLIDNKPFYTFAEASLYLEVSKQAVHQAYSRKANHINNKVVYWRD